MPPAGAIHRGDVSATHWLNTHRVGASAKHTAAGLPALPATGIFGHSLAATPMGDLRAVGCRAPGRGHGAITSALPTAYRDRSRQTVVPSAPDTEAMTDTHITVSGDTIGVEHLVLTDSAHDHLHLRTRPTIRPQALIRLESRLVATDEPIRRIQHVAEGAEVLLDPQPCGAPGARARRSCLGGRLKRRSNSLKAAKLAPRNR